MFPKIPLNRVRKRHFHKELEAMSYEGAESQRRGYGVSEKLAVLRLWPLEELSPFIRVNKHTTPWALTTVKRVWGMGSPVKLATVDASFAMPK